MDVDYLRSFPIYIPKNWKAWLEAQDRDEVVDRARVARDEALIADSRKVYKSLVDRSITTPMFPCGLLTKKLKMADKRGDRNSKKEPPPPPPKYDPPTWVGKPPAGMHLDVSKNDKLVEKLIIDGKDYFLFGRLRDHVDFPLDHASCSRVHAALVFHRHLKRMFIIDLGSTHGTFVGSIRVDPHKPVQVLVDSTLAFGASTRRFTLRERPNAQAAGLDSLKHTDDQETAVHSLLGLPEEDTALDDLTEYNTAQNRRQAAVNDDISNVVTAKKRRRSSTVHVLFREGEEIINPEDIDPTVGRFRNLVQTEMVVPSKKIKINPGQSMTETITKRMQSFSYAPDLYADIPSSQEENHTAGAMAGKISITSAPEVISPKEKVNAIGPVLPDVTSVSIGIEENRQDVSEPRKKKYAKEAWPGKRPGPNLLSV